MTEEPLPKKLEPPADDPLTKEKVKAEDDTITSVTEGVLPRESLTNIAEASAKFAAESVSTDQEVAAKETVSSIETGGRPVISSSGIEPAKPGVRPSDSTLQRGARFRDNSENLRPGKVAAPNAPTPVVKARTTNMIEDLAEFFFGIARTPELQQAVQKSAASYGDSLDEFFKQAFSADGPGAGENQKKVADALKAAGVSPQTAVDALKAIDTAMRTRPIDLAALSKAGQALHDALTSILGVLENSKLSLDAIARPAAALAGLASGAAAMAKMALEGGSISPLSPQRRCMDLGGRLRLLADLPCAARLEVLEQARVSRDSAQSNLDEAKKTLAADVDALKPIDGSGSAAEKALKQKIQQDRLDQTRWAQKYNSTTAAVTTTDRDLQVASKLTKAAYDEIKAGRGKTKPWSSALDSAIKSLKALKSTSGSPLNADDINDLAKQLQSLSGQVDSDFSSLVRQLSLLAPSGPSLGELVETGWDHARLLGQLQDRLIEVLKSDATTAPALDPSRQRLQTTLAGMSALLAELLLIRTRV